MYESSVTILLRWVVRNSLTTGRVSTMSEIPSLMRVPDDRIASGGSCWNGVTTTVRGVSWFDDVF